MNNVQISLLKRTLKKYGIKNAETVVRSKINLNYEGFLDACEPLYAVSRIQSCYENNKDLEKLTSVNKEWMKSVVEQGWCSALIPFVEKHGSDLTLRSILYLIDNSLWDSYKGDVALRTKRSDHYKGLEAIDEAAAYLRDICDAATEKPTEKPTEESTVEEPPTISNEVSGADAAFEASERIRETLTNKIVSILSDTVNDVDTISNFLLLTCDKKVINKEILDLKELLKVKESKLSYVEDELVKANNECARLKHSLNEVQDLVAIRNDEIGKLSRELSEFKNSQETMDSLKKELDNTKTELSLIKGAYEEYKNLPRKRIIKKEEISKLALVGPKLLSTLVPFLERYNIYIED